MGAGFGGTGPVGPPGAPETWGIALVSVTARDADLSGVRVVAITLLDPAGAEFAHAVGPIEVHGVPPGRAPSDLSDTGAKPFTGSLAKGATTLLRVGAALDATVTVAYKVPAGARARVEIVDANGIRVVVEGAAGPWSTG